MDDRLERLLNGPAGHHPWLDTLMRDAATWSVGLFIGIVAAWFLVGWARGRPDERRGALTALLASGAALLVNQVVLEFWQRPRPFTAHPDVVHMLVARSSDPSFPSDHAAAATAVAVVVLLFHRRLGLVAVGLAALVCIARVYVGAHYPGDVLAGAAIGTVVALLLAGPLSGAVARVNDAVTGLIRLLHLPLRDGGSVPGRTPA